VPFRLPGRTLTVSASVGMAYAGPGQAITNQLVVDADIAMYQAKHNGGANHQIIDLRAAQKAHASSTLEQELHRAFARNKLSIAFQPIVRPTDGLLCGAEALLRWVHPQRGPISTTDMVALAEANGLITGIGAWVLETSCNTRQAWLEDRPETSLSIGVNVSARQLIGQHLPCTVEQILGRTDTDPAFVILELTESVFIRDPARALSVMADLKTLGVRLALDDFGTGYSSLTYLRDFPVDIVKIDQSFVATCASDDAGAAIVGGITNMAHDLGLIVVAEGVETQQQADAINQAGVDLAQGFLFAHAMNAAAFDDILKGPSETGIHLASSDGRPAATTAT
jgi:EAL domain-containing protein (putative c-di-GMP-specific phosphodiesterase class I)